MGKRIVKICVFLKYFAKFALFKKTKNILFMKKILLLSFVFSISFVNAQVIQSEDFNGLTLGEVGTDITGATAGQGGFYTGSSNGAAPTTTTNAGNSNFEIIADGTEGSNALRIVSPNGDKGSRLMFKDGLDTAWAARDTGNDIIMVEYDLYTGPATTSNAQVGVRLYGLDNSVTPAVRRVLNGFVYATATGVLSGVMYLNNSGTFGTYLLTLGAANTPLVLDPETWYTVGFAYDTTSGETIWKINSTSTYIGAPAAYWTGPFDIQRLDLISVVPAGTPTLPANAIASDMVVDNLLVRADFEENLLNVATVVNEATFSVYPNPANSVINISNTMNVVMNSVVLTDLNGRTVKSQKLDTVDAQINVSDLATGIYMMNVNTDQGSITKKIIKN